MHLNPYDMWERQSPRQIFELLQSYKGLNEDSEEGESKFTVKSKGLKISKWLRDKIPDGATVYSADDVYQGDM